MKTKWQKFVDEKMTLMALEKNILDVGGGEPFQKWLFKYKDLFAKCNYKTMEPNAESKPDILGDIHAIPLASDSQDAIICHSVLEHVADPTRAVRELYRVLVPGGKLFLHLPSIYPYHARQGDGGYPDYWRFFDDTLKILLKDFKEIEIVKRGGYFTALLFFMPYQHKLRFMIDPLACFLDMIFKTESRTTTAGYYIYAIK